MKLNKTLEYMAIFKKNVNRYYKALIDVWRRKRTIFIIFTIVPAIMTYFCFFEGHNFKKKLAVSDVIGKEAWKLNAEQVVDDNYDYLMNQLFKLFGDRSIKDYLFFVNKVDELVKKQGKDSQIYKYFSGEVVCPHDLFLAIIKLMDIQLYTEKIGEKEFVYLSSNNFDYKSQEYDTTSHFCRNFFFNVAGKVEVEVIEIKEEYVLIRLSDYKITEGMNFRTGSMEYSNNNKSSLLKLIPKQNTNGMIVELINGFHLVETNTKFTTCNTETPTFETDKKTKSYSIKLEFTTDS